MNKSEAAKYLISRMSEDRIDGIDQNHILHNGLDNQLSEAISVLNLAMTANGALYRRDEIGVIPSIIVDYYAERKEVKKEMLSVESEIEAIKAELERRRIQKKSQTDAEYKGDRKRYKV
jgi:hypothetical protein